jgi:hypothetical protein
LRKLGIDSAFTTEGRTGTITITAIFYRARKAEGTCEKHMSAKGSGIGRADANGRGDDPTVRANLLKNNAADGAGR